MRWVPGPEVFVILGHAAASEVLTDSSRFSSRLGAGLVAGGTSGRSLNLDDPPRSVELRRIVHDLLDTEFLPDGLIETVVARAIERGEADALRDLGEPIARGVFAHVVGLEEADVRRLCELTEGLARSGLDRERQARADAELKRVLSIGIAEQRPGPFWNVARAAMERGLTDEDAMFLLRLVVQTGHESTAQAIAGAVYAALQAELPFDGRPLAVEEWLRWTSPLIRFARVAVDDTSVCSVHLPRGARVVVLFPAVNRDESVFHSPGQLELERTPNPHLAFGAGPHRCVGARLARRQLSEVMRALASVDRPRLLGAPARLVSAVTRGFLTVPIAF